MQNFPYPYEVNWELVTENGSLTPICSLSKRSLSPSLTVLRKCKMKNCFVNKSLRKKKLVQWLFFMQNKCNVIELNLLFVTRETKEGLVKGYYF